MLLPLALLAVIVADAAASAGPLCAGATIPLYTYARRYCSKPKRTRSFGDLHTVPDLDAPSSSGSDSDSEADKSFLDQLLVAQWEDRAERGLFRYDVTACETKVMPHARLPPFIPSGPCIVVEHPSIL